MPASVLAKQNEKHNARMAEVDRLLAEDEAAVQRMEVLRHITREEVLQIVRGADIERQRIFLKRLFERIEIHRGFLRFVPTVAEVPPFDAAWPERGTAPEEVVLRLL